MSNEAFALEINMFLHPLYKDPEVARNKVIRVVNNQAGKTRVQADRSIDFVETTVRNKVRGIMRALIRSETDPDDDLQDSADQWEEPSPVFSMEMTELFPLPPDQQQERANSQEQLREQRIDEELTRWMQDSTSLRRSPDGRVETILSFWRHQLDSGNYKYLPNVARIVFAVPTSSAQIERDFGVMGVTLTSQRTSVAPHNVDMTAFLNRNRGFVDVTQCVKLDKADVADHIPSSMTFDIDADMTSEFDATCIDFFSCDLED